MLNLLNICIKKCDIQKFFSVLYHVSALVTGMIPYLHYFCGLTTRFEYLTFQPYQFLVLKTAVNKEDTFFFGCNSLGCSSSAGLLILEIILIFWQAFLYFGFVARVLKYFMFSRLLSLNPELIYCVLFEFFLNLSYIHTNVLLYLNLRDLKTNCLFRPRPFSF